MMYYDTLRIYILSLQKMSLHKKYTALLMAFFLMFSNIGLALNVHFCGDTKVASTTVYSKTIEELCSHVKQHQHPEEENCSEEKFCCGASDDHSDCCKNELIKQD